jgi:hypothetical protein
LSDERGRHGKILFYQSGFTDRQGMDASTQLQCSADAQFFFDSLAEPDAEYAFVCDELLLHGQLIIEDHHKELSELYIDTQKPHRPRLVPIT